MNLRKIRHKAIEYINTIRTYKNGLDVKKDMKKELERGGGYKGSQEEYEKKVIPFWKRYNYIPDKEWFQYYGEILNEFDPRIIPGDFFQSKLLPFLNNLNMQPTLENKFYFDLILSELNKPYTVFKQVNGLILNNKNEIITKEEGLRLLNDWDKVIVKPTNAGGGKGVKIIDLRNNKKESLQILNKYFEADFVVQEVIKQSNQLSSFNKSSVNTVRVISLLINGKVEILSRIIRIGPEGSDVDNYSLGGQERTITPEGMLNPWLYSKKGFSYTDRQGNELKPEKLEGFEGVIKEIKKYHPRFPHLRWIGWDFAIGENLETIFIELNGFAGDSQRNDGPMFKEFTEQVLDEYFEYRKKRKKSK